MTTRELAEKIYAIRISGSYSTGTDQIVPLIDAHVREELEGAAGRGWNWHRREKAKKIAGLDDTFKNAILGGRSKGC